MQVVALKKKKMLQSEPNGTVTKIVCSLGRIFNFNKHFYIRLPLHALFKVLMLQTSSSQQMYAQKAYIEACFWKAPEKATN